MLRLGLRLLVAALALAAVGWLSIDYAFFEVLRISSVACLTLGFLLLFVNYVRTPDPAGR